MLWVVSSLVADKLQVRCLTDMLVTHISPALQIASIENGCEDYSPNIKIPVKSELTGSIEASTQRYFLTTLNA